MMFHMDVQVQWVLSIGTLLCVLSIFMLRKHHRDYPAFAFYLTTLVIVSVIRFSASLCTTRSMYFWLYWGTEIFSVITFLGAASGVLSSSFGPLKTRKPYVNLPPEALFIVGCMFSVVLVLVIKMIGWNESPKFVWTHRFTTIQQVTAGVAFFFLGSAALMSWVLAVQWEKREVGIVIGMLAEVGVGAMLVRLLGAFGMTTAPVVARLLATCVWLLFLSERRPRVKRISPRGEELIRVNLKRMGALKKRVDNAQEYRKHAVSDGGTTNSSVA
jgi:hypothetical protein